MVGGALDRSAGLGEPADGAGELLAGREEEGEVVEPGVAAGGLRAGLLVQDEQVVGARSEPRLARLARVSCMPIERS